MDAPHEELSELRISSREPYIMVGEGLNHPAPMPSGIPPPSSTDLQTLLHSSQVTDQIWAAHFYALDRYNKLRQLHDDQSRYFLAAGSQLLARLVNAGDEGRINELIREEQSKEEEEN